MKTTAAHTVPMTRRGFVQSGVLGLTALSAGRVFGANERINVGLIGFGLIGRFHLASLKEQPDGPDGGGVRRAPRPRRGRGGDGRRRRGPLRRFP